MVKGQRARAGGGVFRVEPLQGGRGLERTSLRGRLFCRNGVLVVSFPPDEWAEPEGLSCPLDEWVESRLEVPWAWLRLVGGALVRSVLDAEAGFRPGGSSGRQAPLRSRSRALRGGAARGGAVSVYIRPGTEVSPTSLGRGSILPRHGHQRPVCQLQKGRRGPCAVRTCSAGGGRVYAGWFGHGCAGQAPWGSRS